MRRILIIEPLCTGHRSSYVRWSASAFCGKGDAVQIATLERSASLLLSPELQEARNKVELLKLPDADLSTPNSVDAFSIVKKELAYWRLFREFYLRSMDTLAPDLVFVPYADYCVNAISLKGSPFGRTPWAGIVMRPSFHLAKMGITGPASKLAATKGRLLKRTLANRSLCTLFTIDETLLAYCRRTWPRQAAKLSYLPDPADLTGSETKDSAREALGIPQGRTVLLVYGSLNLRKGLDDLLHAAERTDFPREIDILLAGRQDEATKGLLKSPGIAGLIKQNRIYQLDHFLTAEEEFRVFAAADIVWLGYKQHFNMSGVLVQAGQMGLPVIASREGLVGWLVREHRLGLTIDTNDRAGVVGAINRLVDDRPGAELFGRNGKATFASHTPEIFGRALIAGLESRQTDPPLQTLLPGN